ncbi:hypothetical protein PoB_003923500 [Plakobranchus ocellatus]|uniref:RNase H type-1 domain-containing protein n=1 Tax=Plakobranchus ocellatus TaxID=259542 RepID=A0AAV4AWH6_9GAST|nr:hypothetical protein PoB_003923500 [Plakobranchus ocellatus]
MRTVVQRLLPHMGDVSNEIADRLVNQGRSQPQSRKPSTLSDTMAVLRRGTGKLWSAVQLSNDNRIPRFYEAYKANDYLQGLHWSGAVQIFRQARGTCSSRRTERDTIGLPLLCVVFAGNKKTRFCMFCPNGGNWSMTAPRDGLPNP